VPPNSATAYGNQLAQLAQNYYSQLAIIAQQKGIIKGDFGVARAQAKTDAIGNMATTVNSGLDRGLSGSSIDLEARAGVDSQRATDIQAAIRARTQGMLGLSADRLAATNDYYTGIYGVQAAKASEEATMAAAALANDAVLRAGDETATGASSNITTGEAAWGGYANGKIPLSDMVYVPQLGKPQGTPGAYLRPDAAAAFVEMARAARQAGVNLDGSGYRTYAAQVATYGNGGAPSASPGTSNHGWGIAIDMNMTAAATAWLNAHAAQYGFAPIASEAWHFEYQTANYHAPKAAAAVNDALGTGHTAGRRQ